ncbi:MULTISPECIES: hypothetical protein [unclassified Streptomyces]|uniref:hypothetical protein n=1 Tax=unclassified Streptomyces TaxID=2593676 RepID=UPI000CD4FB45|nr:MULTISPECIES: hypothetical protein [unclassified Streptomyces]
MPYATVACGDLVEIDGRRRSIETIIQTRAGYLVQFRDTEVMRVRCPPEVCQIDGRTVRLDDIPAGRCLWCRHERRLVAVGRYTTHSGRAVTAYACTGCVAAQQLVPLAFRATTDTEVRRRPVPP